MRCKLGWTLQLVLVGFFVIPCAANEACKITMAITPTNATADHSAPAPGNQVQFLLSSSVEGNCPMIPDSRGVWTTSDSENTTISNNPSTAGLAVCLRETPQPVTISNSGRIRGRSYPPATLICK
ncbi:MAG TPA: hypothetical protein VMB18_18625 [Terriglobales bacterium]|nr:hypothetical protein [Terriglobales bacterium]